MFEQDRHTGERRTRGIFRGEGGPAPGMSRFQVSGENDPAEIQAEQMADSVAGGGLFRSPEGSGGSGFQADLDTADLGEPGESLPGELQSSMEQSFGTRLSGVRVHTGAGADRASRSISARAFTQGQDVYFRSGAYDPESREGRHLIAHELAHVAAGDGGIHRDPDADPAPARPTTGMSRQDILEMALRSGVEHSREDLEKAEELTTSYGNGDKELLLDLVASGEVSKEKLRSDYEQVDTVKSGLDPWIGDLHRNLDGYMDEMAGGEADEAVKESVRNSEVYRAAAETLSKLENTRKELQNTVKPLLTNVLSSIERADASDGSGFPETVTKMMDDAACGQFFKAVAAIRGGAGADFGDLNQTAVDNAQNLHGDVAESGAAKTSRIAGNASTVAGLVSTGADVLSNSADIDEAANTTVNQHSKNTSATGSVVGVTAGSIGTMTDMVGMAADSAALHNQEAERRRKIEEMQARNQDTGIGEAGWADHTARAGVSGAAFGILGGTAGVVSTSADLADDETTSDIAGVTSATLGAAGDVFGLAADSQNAKERKDKDKEAKQNMKALGQQLRATLPTSTNLTGKNLLILQISERLKGEKFNASGNEPLANLIDQALSTSASNANAGGGAQDELSAKQKNLLITLKALETSRVANKGAMSDARKDALFSTIGLVGSLTSLAGSVASMLGSKLAGSILGMVGTVIGMVGTIRDAIGLGEKESDRQQARNDDRDAKVAACQTAVGQMAALPELRLDVLRGKREKKLPLTGEQQAAAEQYASVFTLIKTADVNMVDFLYAVDKGEFGKKTGPGENDKKSTQDSLKDMYANLSFS